MSLRDDKTFLKEGWDCRRKYYVSTIVLDDPTVSERPTR